jgi:hypothetical protein
MIRLNTPERDFTSTLDECIRGITGNANLKAKFSIAKNGLIQAGSDYCIAGIIGELYTIAPIDAKNGRDPVVIEGLLKSELVNLYEYYFRNEEKDARKIYDQLLNAAHEKCPFCGGIGTPRNLDHFLPKAHFPQFSTLPENLVPCCRDCNMDGKADAFAKTAAKQIIQPYVDHDRFFASQWVFADYVVISDRMPGTLRYFAQPPKEWDQVYKDRVSQHFGDFNLAKRFAIKAAELLGTTQAQIDAMRERGATDAVICDDLLKPGIESAPFVNHWQKGMFQALYKFLQ